MMFGKPKQRVAITDKNGKNTTVIKNIPVPPAAGSARLESLSTPSRATVADRLRSRVEYLRKPQKPREYERSRDVADRLERDKENSKLADYIERTEPEMAPKDAMALWLSVHIRQGGAYTLVNKSSEEFTTPTKDAALNFPTSYGANAINTLLIQQLTPSITLEPSRTDGRKGWEFGHSKVRRLSVEDGIIFANTNESRPEVTQDELSAARKIPQGDITRFANEMYKAMELDVDVRRTRNSTDEKTDKFDKSYYITDEQQWENWAWGKNHGGARYANLESADSSDKLFSDTPKDSRGEPLRSKSSSGSGSGKTRSGRDEDDFGNDSISRAIRDPLGISDPGGVRDPLAGMIRSQLFGGGGFGE